ncbi:adenylyl-sulfate kinase [Nitrospina sp. 32_T5]|uniref:adenylyl-sulfate kinase n=1 Tax=unclassified Nitrospina TaxID=2638683 RepID=UPI003F98FDB6
MVIWLLGISGSGKSTLGKRLKFYCDSIGINSWVIDGDIVRNFFDNDLGFEKADRVQNIKRILLAAHALSENGIVPIVCNISPFEELRCFARKKLKNYIQIYLKKSVNTSRQEDVKKIYQQHIGRTPVVGVDLEFDEPGNNDLILDIENETVDQSFQKIKSYLKINHPGIFQ